MTKSVADRYDFETGIYRPPSEGGSNSLLVRLTRNCPWNRCTFCGMYKTEKFQVRSVAEIKKDIDAMAALRDDMAALSGRSGQPGEVSHQGAVALIGKYPELNYHQGFAMLYHWLLSGAKTVFLQDANSLIMKTDQLVDVLTYLRRTFPSIVRITSYARSKTLMQKPIGELQAIRQAGLDRVHVGLESGDDTVLEKIRKGATAEVHIKGGRKALDAGFQLSEYWMPGLGGKALWQTHATNTARVLSEIDPHYIRSRPFRPWDGTPMAREMAEQSFEMLTAEEQLRELRLTMETLSVTGRVCFDHAGNYWRDRKGRLLFSHSYEGYKFPEEKKAVLDRIEEGLKRPSEFR
ncbi:radical SAM protein [Desulfosarcina ovata]|uniref:Radical SAM protein n=1 Tax=Desulfosarcina ovata subsp. ovata TaxID=2752305 RepID=A0A5K8AAS4_9BACT|nr:radical SAM protein [Desulfosarcina ovata]BBO89050.1 radical SAM protein [Desulfosarcina ovata subsp. ovata]